MSLKVTAPKSLETFQGQVMKLNLTNRGRNLGRDYNVETTARHKKTSNGICVRLRQMDYCLLTWKDLLPRPMHYVFKLSLTQRVIIHCRNLVMTLIDIVPELTLLYLTLALGI